MRRLFAMLSSIALAVAGSQLAHVTTYRILAPDAHQREHLLAETGHAYLRFAPLALAVVSVVVLIALVTEARAAGLGSSYRPRLWTFALIAPATFASQEIFERLIHDGAVPWHAPLEKTFVLGLALQLPFAVAASAFARFLLGAARIVGRLLAGPRLAPIRAGSIWSHATLSAPLPALYGVALGPRGPPSPLR